MFLAILGAAVGDARERQWLAGIQMHRFLSCLSLGNGRSVTYFYRLCLASLQGISEKLRLERPVPGWLNQP